VGVGYKDGLEDATNLLVSLFSQSVDVAAQEPATWDGQVRNWMRMVGRLVLQSLLVGAAETSIAQERERGYVVHKWQVIRVRTVLGTVEVPSPQMKERRSGTFSRPVRRELGFTGAMMTPALERAVTDFGAEESIEHAAKRVAEHYGMEVGRTSVLRVVKRRAEEAEQYVANRLEAAAEDYLEPLAERPGVDQVITELDGSMVRTGVLRPVPDESEPVVQPPEQTSVDTPGATSNVESSCGAPGLQAASNASSGQAVPSEPTKARPKRRRDEHWHELKVGLVRVAGEASCTYVARMGSYKAVVRQLFAAAVERGMSWRTKVFAVSDGGQGLMEELQAQFPNFTFLLDRPHLLQHLHEAAAEADATGSTGRPDKARQAAWVRTALALIDAGDVHAVIEAARTYAQLPDAVDEMRRLAGYLEHFSSALDYQGAKAAGLPTGSGEIESAHRYIQQKRLKIPGACWHPKSVNPMASLRVLRANDWWEDFWASRPTLARAA